MSVIKLASLKNTQYKHLQNLIEQPKYRRECNSTLLISNNSNLKDILVSKSLVLKGFYEFNPPRSSENVDDDAVDSELPCSVYRIQRETPLYYEFASNYLKPYGVDSAVPWKRWNCVEISGPYDQFKETMSQCSPAEEDRTSFKDLKSNQLIDALAKCPMLIVLDKIKHGSNVANLLSFICTRFPGQVGIISHQSCDIFSPSVLFNANLLLKYNSNLDSEKILTRNVLEGKIPILMVNDRTSLSSLWNVIISRQKKTRPLFIASGSRGESHRVSIGAVAAKLKTNSWFALVLSSEDKGIQESEEFWRSLSTHNSTSLIVSIESTDRSHNVESLNVSAAGASIMSTLRELALQKEASLPSIHFYPFI